MLTALLCFGAAILASAASRTGARMRRALQVGTLALAFGGLYAYARAAHPGADRAPAPPSAR
jgi:hypothetical protein